MDKQDELTQKKMNAILSATPWRCFHCDFITNNEEEARAHFGDRDDASEFVPICKWWASMPDDERKHVFQELQRDLSREQDENGDLRQQIESLEDRLNSAENSIRQYKPFKNCNSSWDVFCKYDSMEGRALAAEKRERVLVDAVNNAGFAVFLTNEGKTVLRVWNSSNIAPRRAK